MVEFVVTVPVDAEDRGPLFLTGDGAAFGHWRADAVRLDCWGDITFRTRLDLRAGDRHRYLVTRGHWRAAETDGQGRELAARELVVPDRSISVYVHCAGWGRNAVRYYHDFRSEYLLHPRPIVVYVPPGYDLDPSRRYPVLYMHDGQNLFDAHTAFAGVPWGCDQVAERTARNGTAAPVIIVGIGNTPDRIREYGPRRSGPSRSDDLSRKYARFLVHELKPFIDREYRTRPDPANTGVGGSSMGGLISLHLCKWFPSTFGRCAAMSPSIWWDREFFLRNASVTTRWSKGVKVWLDMGGREGGSEAGMAAMLNRARTLAELFRRRGMIDGVDFNYLEVPDGHHNEHDWGRRFDQVLGFLFPTE